MKQRKSHGQVFLNDKTLLERIAAIVLSESLDVLEIGSGDGRLSVYLTQSGKKLYCLEVDRRFFSMLKKIFSACNNVEIIHEDILKFSLEKLGKKIVVCGNIPYHISKQLVVYLTGQRDFISKAFLTVQKEFAQKVYAAAGSPQYCYLSCYLQYYAAVSLNFEIPAAAFIPAPKVDSSFIAIDYSKPFALRANNEEKLWSIIRAAFTQRRKKIVNSLKPIGVDKDFLHKSLISESARAQDISLAQYVNLANLSYGNNP